MKFGWEIIPGVNASRGDRWVLYAQEDACRRAELHIYPGMGMKTGGFLWKGKWYTPAEPAWSRFLQGVPSFGADPVSDAKPGSGQLLYISGEPLFHDEERSAPCTPWGGL